MHGLPQHAEREVVLVESSAVLRRRRYHRQKLHLLLSGMRHLDDELGDRSTYHRTTTYREALEKVGRPVVVHQPTSHTAVEFVEEPARGGAGRGGAPVDDVRPAPRGVRVVGR